MSYLSPWGVSDEMPTWLVALLDKIGQTLVSGKSANCSLIGCSKVDSSASHVARMSHETLPMWCLLDQLSEPGAVGHHRDSLCRTVACKVEWIEGAILRWHKMAWGAVYCFCMHLARSWSLIGMHVNADDDVCTTAASQTRLCWSLPNRCDVEFTSNGHLWTAPCTVECQNHQPKVWPTATPWLDCL